MKKMLLCIALVSNFAFSQNDKSSDSKGTVGINPEYSYKMLEPVYDLRKVEVFMDQRAAGALDNKSLTIGASIISIGDYQKSNIDSKFAYLMRHPTSSNQIGKEVSEAALHSFQLAFTAVINNWMAGYAEILYNPEQSFGTGTITDLNRNQLQLRKGYVLIGDLNAFPLYGAIGKMDAPFGQMGGINPFTNTSTWHAFAGLCYGAQISFKKWDIHATVMAAQGGTQFRAMFTPVGDSTNIPSMVNNFTADLNYTVHFGENLHLNFGASYMHGTAYSHDFPVQHFQATSNRNPAYTFYGNLKYKERFELRGGYVKTLEVWEGTHNPTPPLDIYAASKVSSYDAGGKINFNLDGKAVFALSGEFSNFTAGPDGAPWQRQNQYILGFSAMVNKSCKIFLEGFRTEGYVPLNWISGSDPFAPFPPGTTHSSRDAISHGIVIGAMIDI